MMEKAKRDVMRESVAFTKPHEILALLDTCDELERHNQAMCSARANQLTDLETAASRIVDGLVLSRKPGYFWQFQSLQTKNDADWISQRCLALQSQLKQGFDETARQAEIEFVQRVLSGNAKAQEEQG